MPPPLNILYRLHHCIANIASKIHLAKNNFMHLMLLLYHLINPYMIKRFVLPFLIILCLFSCNSSKKASSSKSGQNAEMLSNNFSKLIAISTDETYGFTQENPIKVGGVKDSEGPLNERRFLNALLGPEGQSITYHRQGSCCHFKSPNGLMGSGLLDRYEVNYNGLAKPVIIFINMYDFGELKAPKGFTFRQ